MSEKLNHYRKYQVYFFLYLAVICELLIIIVERDDAEAGLLAQQRNLEERTRRIILELLKNMPAVTAAGDNRMKPNEPRVFTVAIRGLGTSDKVTTQPTVLVSRDGTVVDSLRYHDPIIDFATEDTSGERLYRFEWAPRHGPGLYTLEVAAGSDRVAWLTDGKAPTGRVKVGSLEFSKNEIRAALDSDPVLAGMPIDGFITDAEKLKPDRIDIEVIAEEYDALQIAADPIVIAAGFPAFNEIKVRGTTADKVSTINADAGMVMSPGDTENPWYNPNPEYGRWTWTSTFNTPGTYTVTVDARDRRDAGAKSVSRPVTFDVTVRAPHLSRPKPVGAFEGELFEQHINVAGLEDVGSYRWSMLLGGKQVHEGNGHVVRFMIPDGSAGKTLELSAKYRGRTYMLYPDSASAMTYPSEFLWTVSAPRERFASMSFASGGEYPINNVFQFVAARCGRCSPENIRNASPSDIKVIVEMDGRDILDDVMYTPRVDAHGREAGTLVKFFLNTRTRLPRDGEDAVIILRYGTFTETVPVRLLPE